MKEIIRWYPAEHRLEWNGGDYFLKASASKIFNFLLLNKGEWKWAEDIAPELWPAMNPDYYRNCITNYARQIALALSGTSAKLESASKKGKAHSGFRLTGEVEVVHEMIGGKCPSCGRHMRKGCGKKVPRVG